MPAPAVYVLAVVTTIGAVYAFHHSLTSSVILQFVYEPHLAPKLEQFAEEYVARRRARRLQGRGPIPVPAEIPLRRRQRGGRSKHSDSTLSDSDSDLPFDDPRSGTFGKLRDFPMASGSSARDSVLSETVTQEVSEWRTAVGRSQAKGSLRHRTPNITVIDESIIPIPHPTMSPTHVISDTSVPTTPTITTVPSTLSSPPIQVSPLSTTGTESVLQLSPSVPVLPLSPSPLSQSRTPLPTTPRTINSTSTLMTGPVLLSAAPPDVASYSPPSFSSPIPSLSESYPQELDRERGIELLSPPSSGTSSPFTTFSPLVAPQALSPFAVIQHLDPNPSSEVYPRSPNTVARLSSPSQDALTDATASIYRSLPASPTSHPSELSSPVHVARESLPSPSHEELSRPSTPTPINFTSPNALSPRSPHTDLSDLDFESDIDMVSDQGSEESDHSWSSVSSGYLNGR